MKITNRVFSAVTLLIASALCVRATAPDGWFLAGSKPAEYQTAVDPQTAYNGRPSASLKNPNPIDGFGTLMQQFAADDFRGKRVRLSAFVKADKVQDWAGLWMRIDKGKEVVGFDNMQSRAIKGTLDWKRYEVVLDVPSDATGIAFGILLSSAGTVWINSANFQVVDKATPLTGAAYPKKADSPSNLSFEK